MGVNNGHHEPEGLSDNELTDDEVVGCVQKGNPKAFEILVQRYEQKIFKFFFRLMGNASDSEDLTQEVFVSAFRALSKYQSRGFFGAWLFTIARNTSRNFSGKKIRDSKLLSPQEIPDDVQDPTSAIQPSVQDDVQTMLAPLPEEYRRVMILKYVSGLTCEEISKVETISESAVKQRLHRAREMIRELRKPES
ncbi:MAG TPA: RNA polymerase sigma factor [Candidatus Ozemobacteraceae bacterium]|nr:RNA polymerase sigma factor [Candidatus Ozemobacteraceae bacterium]